MPTVRGCNLPDELLYDVENNIWYRENADGTVTVGMTAVAAAMAGQLVAFTAKKAGRAVHSGKSCATIESGKWVGPAKIAFDAEVVVAGASGAVADRAKPDHEACESVRKDHRNRTLAFRPQRKSKGKSAMTHAAPTTANRTLPLRRPIGSIGNANVSPKRRSRS
jgi:hypothetical protein